MEHNDGAAIKYLEDNLTDRDISAWHRAELTPHAEQVINEAGVEPTYVQIWGSRTGPEPLTITVD